MPLFPANIDLSSLNGTNGFALFGEASRNEAGISVASAGDINGDGFADMVVGAFYANIDYSIRSGASYVVFGKASGFAAGTSLSTLDGSNGFRLSSTHSLDKSGTSVSSAGDVNGDGFADVIIGAPGANANASDSGASYVLYGKASGFAADVNLDSSSVGVVLQGTAYSDYSGDSVSSAGDVNGDGIADMIVGAPRAEHDPNDNNSGAAYVVFGTSPGLSGPVDLSSLSGTNGFRLSGAAQSDYAGRSVAAAGDVNGDGFADVIIGAYGADPHGSYSGASYVVFGKGTGIPADVNLGGLTGTNGFRLSGVATGDKSGISVAAAGDVNGDGYDDIIIGAPYAAPGGIFRAGQSYVVFGSATAFPANIDLSTLNGTNGFKLSGGDSNDLAGKSVASAGDVNGDGFDDVIVGAPLGAATAGVPGVSYVVFGKASGFAANIALTSLDGNTGFKLTGVGASQSGLDQSGHSVASAGDVNGDGFADLIVGGPGADKPNSPYSYSTRDYGAAYIVFGIAPTTVVNRTGTAASQTLAGGALADTLSGLGGNDQLYGNGGADTLIGGSGHDRFEFGTASLADAASHIFDDVKDYNQGNIGHFSAGEGDQIDVSIITATALVAGQATGALIRVASDSSNAHALLQVDADGTANGIHWQTLAQLDGVHQGDSVNVVLGGPQPLGTAFSVLSDNGHFGDSDGDGKADVIWRNDNGVVAVWQMNGGAVGAGHFLAGVSADWHIMGSGDFNGDGRSDILWQNDNGAVIYWQMDNSGQFSFAPSLGSSPANSVLVGVGDVDHDSKSDLLWRDVTTGAVTIKTMAGAVATISGVGTDWGVVGIGDYNGDGKADVMFRNESQGVNAAWLVNGTTVTSTVFYSGVPNDWHVVGTGDFNGDGKSDLLWHNDNGGNAVWLMNASGNVAQAGFFSGVGADWHVVGTGDFNNDHIDDVIWRNDAGATAVWQMNGVATPAVSFPGGVPNDWATQAHSYDFV